MNEIVKFDKAALTKAGANTMAQNFIDALENGSVNPLELALVFKTVEAVQKQIGDKLKEHAIAEAQKYEKTFTYLGNEVTLSDNLGVKYDYSNCGHREYDELLKTLEPLLKRKEQIEEELKAMKSKRTELDTNTGEVYDVFPPVRKSSTNVVISLK
jgi:hypothetical protein